MCTAHPNRCCAGYTRRTQSFTYTLHGNSSH
uniref:Uncharacterized protein n=1 Tax=Physcomitrium patens TaxID=3218 RepID=A0A2K1IEK8_PHYPA|nr:hypothetical protein PHYPA_029857 [Physcomitrium patens]